MSRAIAAGDESWHVPEEVPIAFVYNRRNYAVMMGTPADFVDFALGFSLTEEVVAAPEEITALDVHIIPRGIELKFKITEAALERLDITQRRRNMVGSASCGLCGLENADVLFKALPKVSETPIEIKAASLSLALKTLQDHQELNQLTRTVHAAGWVDMTGEIKTVREDVGRHNALDKLLGAMTRADSDMQDGFVIMSSRCSYEIVEKAARRGVKAILSVSAPTSFALQKAKEAHMAIYTRNGLGAVRLL